MDYADLKRMLMEDPEFLEFVKVRFMEALETHVSLKVMIESARKKCAVCGSTMFLRASKKDGGFFWGCSSYPKCRGLEQATEADIAKFAKDHPEQFAVLDEQRKIYKEEKEASGVVGYDTPKEAPKSKYGFEDSKLEEAEEVKKQPVKRTRKKAT